MHAQGLEFHLCVAGTRSHKVCMRPSLYLKIRVSGQKREEGKKVEKVSFIFVVAEKVVSWFKEDKSQEKGCSPICPCSECDDHEASQDGRTTSEILL